MTPESVRRQIEDLTSRLVRSSLSVKQYPPSIKTDVSGDTVIGLKVSSAISLKDEPYEGMYQEMDCHDSYHIKMIDGGLITFFYVFTGRGILRKHCLSYLPCVVLPTAEEAPELYERDELYADILSKRLVRFPIRFDFAPEQSKDILHPASHLTLGQFNNCRIPVAGPVSPVSFVVFILRNFYHQAYIRNKNTFDKQSLKIARTETISVAERKIMHIMDGV